MNIKKNLIRKTWAGQSVTKTYKQKPTSKTYLQKERLKNRILVFCQSPRPTAEIDRELGMNRIYLVTHYLTPMVKEGLLAYTNPDYPPARNQKYVTRAGRK